MLISKEAQCYDQSYCTYSLVFYCAILSFWVIGDFIFKRRKQDRNSPKTKSWTNRNYSCFKIKRKLRGRIYNSRLKLIYLILFWRVYLTYQYGTHMSLITRSKRKFINKIGQFDITVTFSWIILYQTTVLD